MITNSDQPNKGGRPRQFENVDVFHATARVLFEIGYGPLTINAVAIEVGCSAPALSKRFGSKRALIEAYLAWADSNMRARFQEVRLQYASPLEALVARYSIPMEERLEEFGPLTGADEILRDPNLNHLHESAWAAWGKSVTGLLDEAIRVGELQSINAEEISELLGDALAGATNRSIVSSGDMIQRYVHIVELVLRPYLTERAPSILRPGHPR